MVPKRINQKCENFNSGSNGLAMDLYPMHNPIYFNRRNVSTSIEIYKLAFLFEFLLGDMSSLLIGYGHIQQSSYILIEYSLFLA